MATNETKESAKNLRVFRFEAIAETKESARKPTKILGTKTREKPPKSKLSLKKAMRIINIHIDINYQSLPFPFISVTTAFSHDRASFIPSNLPYALSWPISSIWAMNRKKAEKRVHFNERHVYTHALVLVCVHIYTWPWYRNTTATLQKPIEITEKNCWTFTYPNLEPNIYKFVVNLK